MIGIDFTASNLSNGGKNLHNVSDNGLNEYQKCIKAVSDILITYD